MRVVGGKIRKDSRGWRETRSGKGGEGSRTRMGRGSTEEVNGVEENYRSRKKGRTVNHYGWFFSNWNFDWNP